MNDRPYELLREIKASNGTSRIELGEKGRCRFCESKERSKFRKLAHTFPESLGNKWIISLDECDDCNAKFSVYEDALAKAVSPFLTIGGMRGKGNRVRQTGRSAGDTVVSHHDGAKRRQLSFSAKGNDPAEYLTTDPASEKTTLRLPIAGVPFMPRYAYKALEKMAYALLPNEELDRYKQLRLSLLDFGETNRASSLEVGMSFGSVGNAPPLLAACLLRRCEPSEILPHILFFFCAGSICLQINLTPDSEIQFLPTPTGLINIQWSNILAPPGQPPLKTIYSKPVHLDWAATASTPQPIEFMLLDFDPATSRGEFTPVFRRT